MRAISVISSWVTSVRFTLSQFIRASLHTYLKKPIAIAVVYGGAILRFIGLKKLGIKLILKGRRVGFVARADKIIKNIIDSFGSKNSEFDYVIGARPDRPIEVYAPRILILKTPTIKNKILVEKGAIIFKFSEIFTPMYLALDTDLLAKYFRIILEPSSAGYSAEEILIWTKLNSEKVVVFSPHDDDFNFLSKLSTNLLPVKLGAADWVNPTVFHKIKDSKKVYDVIYVANFNPIKRVDRYINAVVRINQKDKDFKAALVCAGFGPAKNEIMAMLERVKNKSNITFFDGMKQPELNKVLNKSKVNILLSLREGANKGLSEGLFAGTPALLLAENVGVKRETINEHTGKIVPDADLEDTLIWFASNFNIFKADEWANENISPYASSTKLSEILKELELSEGREWTKQLYPKVNQPELAYLHAEDSWLSNKRAELLTQFTKGTAENDVINFLEQLHK